MASTVTAEIVSHDTPGFMENDYKLKYASPKARAPTLFVFPPPPVQPRHFLMELTPRFAIAAHDGSD